MKFIPMGIYRDSDTRTLHMKASDYSTAAYDAVELRSGQKQDLVIIMRSKRTAPLMWKVVYGFSEVFFRSFAEAVEFCNSRGFQLVKEQME